MAKDMVLTAAPVSFTPSKLAYQQLEVSRIASLLQQTLRSICPEHVAQNLHGVLERRSRTSRVAQVGMRCVFNCEDDASARQQLNSDVDITVRVACGVFIRKFCKRSVKSIR